ncbi:hypothetical protein HYZ99_03135 [Candidatus Peregrinibacteria bacterium]|nr:hypothetical protein [Candidatus Peregrinibacteria bacterium]
MLGFPSSSSDIPHRSSLGRMVNQSTVLLMASIGSLILVLALLILFHENANATKGYRLRSLERERSLLLLEQEVLNMHIAESQAMETLQNDNLIQVMVSIRNPKYTEGESEVALRRK